MLHGVSVWLVGAALLTAVGAPSAGVWKEYETQKAHAGHDADSQVRLALWCEQHGLQPERLKHLALAVLRDPTNQKARGLLGLVDFRGKWQAPEAVTEKLKADAARAEVVKQYVEKRAKAGDDADAQWKLGLWCEQNGLNEESVAHLRAVVRLDPGREAAWKRLGYRKLNGHWVSDAQLAAAKANADAQKVADRHWRPLLERARESFESKSDARRAAAEAFFETVTDPRAVPSIWAVFAAKPDPTRQAVAVRLLGQLDAASASRCLTILAVSGASAEVRRAAAETLPRRDVREFGDILVAMVQDPIQYEVKPVGSGGDSGTVAIHGKGIDLKRVYTPPTVASPSMFGLLPTDSLTFDAAGLPVLIRPFSVQGESVIGRMGGRFLVSSIGYVQIPVGRMAAESERSRAAARTTQENDVVTLESKNALVRQANERVLPLLARISGHDLGPDRDAWDAWWVDQIGMRILPQKSQEMTTIVEQVPIDFQSQAINPAVTITGQLAARTHSCFGAGTLVRTREGARAIESLAPGDVVLTQSTTTGALGYHPVLKVYRNLPTATFRVSIDYADAIISSPFHRFWVAGRGWIMARDLKPGDVLRTLGGLTRISAVDDDRVQPVFNLEVADDADFFAGRASALVHDNSLPDLRLAPFDAPVKTGGNP
jgi:Pretoxin HINT domain